MTVKVTQPSINLRERISEIKTDFNYNKFIDISSTGAVTIRDEEDSDPNYVLGTDGIAFVKPHYISLDNSTWFNVMPWDSNAPNRSGAASMLIMLSTHTGTTGGRNGLYMIYIPYNATSVTVTTIGGNTVSLSARISDGFLQIQGWDGGVGLQTTGRFSVIAMNDPRQLAGLY